MQPTTDTDKIDNTFAYLLMIFMLIFSLIYLLLNDIFINSYHNIRNHFTRKRNPVALIDHALDECLNHWAILHPILILYKTLFQ